MNDDRPKVPNTSTDGVFRCDPIPRDHVEESVYEQELRARGRRMGIDSARAGAVILMLLHLAVQFYVAVLTVRGPRGAVDHEARATAWWVALLVYAIACGIVRWSGLRRFAMGMAMTISFLLLLSGMCGQT